MVEATQAPFHAVDGHDLQEERGGATNAHVRAGALAALVRALFIPALAVYIMM